MFQDVKLEQGSVVSKKFRLFGKITFGKGKNNEACKKISNCYQVKHFDHFLQQYLWHEMNGADLFTNQLSLLDYFVAMAKMID